MGQLELQWPNFILGVILATFSYFLNGPGSNHITDMTQNQNQKWKHTWLTFQNFWANFWVYQINLLFQFDNIFVSIDSSISSYFLPWISMKLRNKNKSFRENSNCLARILMKNVGTKIVIIFILVWKFKVSCLNCNEKMRKNILAWKFQYVFLIFVGEVEALCWTANFSCVNIISLCIDFQICM